MTGFFRYLYHVFLSIRHFNYTYITYSLKYTGNKYRIIDRRLDYVRLKMLELCAAEIHKKGIQGALAEVGVYKGDFAKYINLIFKDKPLYLFDTFNGFDERDVATEKKMQFGEGKQNFSDTSVRIVLNKMKYPGQCIVKAGFFPDSAKDLDVEFCFVSIDTDLYTPIKEGLNYFYNRLIPGGYIFVHDFNNENYPGARAAVEEFCSNNKINFIPIPDLGGSAIIVK